MEFFTNTTTNFFIVLALLTIAVLTPVVGYLIRSDRETRATNAAAAEKVTSEMLEMFGWSHKKIWVCPRKRQFVLVLLGVMPEHRKVWARVSMDNMNLKIAIEYYLPDVSTTHIHWANILSRNFEKRGLSVDVVPVSKQPEPGEIVDPNSYDPDEGSDALPPFSRN